MNQTHLKWISQALSKARAEKIKISWSDYYPMCPRCGSWEAERHRGGALAILPDVRPEIKRH